MTRGDSYWAFRVIFGRFTIQPRAGLEKQPRVGLGIQPRAGLEKQPRPKESNGRQTRAQPAHSEDGTIRHAGRGPSLAIAIGDEPTLQKET